MSITVTRTKVIKPGRRSDLISRQRLLAMTEDLLDYRLTLVTAPAGYGKTSLLVDLADHLDVPCCWLTLDPLDQDLHRFLVHFIASIKTHFPAFGGNSLSLVQSLGQKEHDLGRLVRTIVNDAYEHIQEHFVLVLDDYHLIDGNQQINRFVSQFGQEVDENCHLVISSRTLLDLPDLPLMVGRSQVNGLSFEELAFQPEEIQRLMEHNYNRVITDKQARQLAQSTEGWITGLLLSAEISSVVPEKRARLTRASGIDLYDYLAEQVFEQQPGNIQTFMLRTSLLEEFNALLCRDILGDIYPVENWSDLIQAVLHENLFVIPLDNQGTWIRYHHLFRDFLQARLAEVSPEEEQQLLRRFIGYYLEKRRWEKAYQFGTRLGDQEILASLIDSSAAELMKDGRMRLLRTWIDKLPDHSLAEHPNLLSRYGAVATVLGDPQLGLTYLEQAENLITSEDHLLPLARNLVWQASALRFTGNHQESLKRSLRALKITGEEKSHLPVRAQASKAAGLAHYRLGRTAEALQMLQDSIAVYKILDDRKDAALATMDLGLVYMQTGRFSRAADLFQQALDVWLESGNITHQATLYNNLGVLYHRTGRYLQSYEHFQQASECARQSGYIRMEAYAGTSLGDLYFDLGFIEKARESYHQAFTLASEIDDHFLIRYLEIMDARIYRVNGDNHRAHLILSSLEPDLKEHGSDQELGTWYIEKGLVELEDNRALAAAEFFGTARKVLSGSGTNLDSLRAMLYRAYALALADQPEESKDVLGKALQQASGLESLDALIPAALDLKPFLTGARSDHPVSITLDVLLDLTENFKDKVQEMREQTSLPPAVSEDLTPDYSVQAFGRPEVLQHGQPIKAKEWINQKSARDLFFYLLASDRGKQKKEIARDLWPENAPESYKRKFKNAVYRLRRALGKEIVLYNPRSRLYSFNRDLALDYDVDTFREACLAAERAANPEEQRRALERAVKTYTHPYLAGRNDLWVESQRAELTLQFQKAALALAELHLNSDQPDHSLGICQQVLEIDPCQEDAHRLAMRAYAVRGDRSGVARQFELCREAFARVLQSEPSSPTTALYQSLLD